MRWVSTVSDESRLEKALAAVSEQLRTALDGVTPDLLVVFVSEHHQSAYDRVPALLASLKKGSILIGCSAGGVIGGGREIERRPGVSLTAAVLPGVDVIPFYLENETLPGTTAPAAAWETAVRTPASTQPHFLLLPDPFTFDAETFVAGLDQSFPGSTKIGGLASGGREPGANALYLDDAVHRSGMVGVALAGDIDVDTIVAQGCRPIGEPMFVTKCERNVLMELDGRRPVDILEELYRRAAPRDQELFRQSLFLGIVMEELRSEYHRGDFLIRNLIGMDADSGALAIGSVLRAGQVVQFHLRDARTSAEDLDELLAHYERSGGPVRPAGSLLFSCLGRGMHLYGRPDHDTDALRERLGDVPLGGFFCNGEIGPVHGTTFLHGYTSSFGFFRRRRVAA